MLASLMSMQLESPFAFPFLSVTPPTCSLHHRSAHHLTSAAPMGKPLLPEPPLSPPCRLDAWQAILQRPEVSSITLNHSLLCSPGGHGFLFPFLFFWPVCTLPQETSLHPFRACVAQTSRLKLHSPPCDAPAKQLPQHPGLELHVNKDDFKIHSSKYYDLLRLRGLPRWH